MNEKDFNEIIATLRSIKCTNGVYTTYDRGLADTVQNEMVEKLIKEYPQYNITPQHFVRERSHPLRDVTF